MSFPRRRESPLAVCQNTVFTVLTPSVTKYTSRPGNAIVKKRMPPTERYKNMFLSICFSVISDAKKAGKKGKKRTTVPKIQTTVPKFAFFLLSFVRKRGRTGVFSPVTCYVLIFFAKKFGGMKKRLYFCAQHTHPASRKNSALRVSVFLLPSKYDTAYIYKDISVASGANCAA